MTVQKLCGGPLCACEARASMEEATMDAQRPRSPADAPRRPPGRPDRQQPHDDRRTIATFPKSSVEEVRVSLSKFKGFDLVDARVWAEPDDGDGDRRPTRKGLCLRVERLPELIEALHLAEEAARKAGLL